jgi:hypothetical protein
MNANALSNRISLDIPADDMLAIQSALKTLQDKLQPHLVDLGPDERRKLPKMGAKTVDFVSKTLSYASTNPQLRPAFVDIDEFSRDLSAVGTLRALQQPLNQLADMVDDSLLLSGSEAYAAALACYQSIKSAARLNMPGAATIASDLAERFASQGPKVGGKPATVGEGTPKPGVGA